MNKKILSVLQYLLLLGLSIFLIWWSLRKISDKEWREITDAFRNADYWLILPVMFCLLLSHFSRAMRWRILMEPLGHQPRIANTYIAVLIGYMANLALPRLGEILKCTILSRYEKVPADKLVGTIVAERAFDVLCLATVILITVLTQADVIGSHVSDALNSIVQSKAGAFSFTRIIILVAALALLVGGTIFIFKRFAHVRFIQKIRTIMNGIWRGLTSARYLKKKGWFAFHTVFIWTMYLMSVYIGLFAMDATSVYGIKEALAVLTMGSLALIVPVPGGGLGVYPDFVQRTMAVYGLKYSLGIAFGWLMWSVQFFFVLIVGFLALMALPYFNKSRINEKG